MTDMIISFADCEVDAERRQLRRNGALVGVEPRVFDLLLTMIRERERVVAHRELVETVWQGSAVSRSAVNAGMSRLRSALGDSTGRVIKSFPRYGYRFIAEVQQRPRSIPRARLTGRTRELDLLTSVASEAHGGRGRIVFVHGDAGIGKTRLIEALAARASDAGVPVLTGVCDESESPPLLWPWLQILGACLAEAGAGVWRTQLADLGSELARVLPALRARFPPTPLVADHPEEARVRLLQAVSAAIAILATDTPLMMVLEDAQWADADSISVVHQVARRIDQRHLLLIVADRTPPPRRRFTVEGSEADLCLPLHGLDCRATRELAEDISEEIWSERKVAALHDLSGGNPLFIRELIRQPDSFDDGVDSVPDSLRELLDSELTDLSPDARQFLLYAAVANAPTFSAATLQRAARLKAGAAAGAIDQAVRARVLVPANGSEDDYRFRVPLQRLYLRSKLGRLQQEQIRGALRRVQKSP